MTMASTTTPLESKTPQSPYALFSDALSRAARDTLDGEVVIKVRFRGGREQGTQVSRVDNYPQAKPQGASDG